LNANEWAALEAADLRRRRQHPPKRASFALGDFASAFGFVPAGIPLEVVPVSLTGTRDDTSTKVDLTGMLILRRASLETIVRTQKTKGAEQGRVDAVLRELADNLSRWIEDISTAPEFDKLSAKDVGRYLWVPGVLSRLQHIRHIGTPSERKHARRLLRMLVSQVGRPPKARTETEDAKVLQACIVARADRKFLAGINLYLERRKRQGYDSSSDLVARDLRQMRLSQIQIDAIIGCRSVESAVTRYVAATRELKPNSVKTMVSRAQAARRQEYLASIG
jgi:hypothetical protein